MKIDLALHPIASAVISKTGYIDLADSPDTKLKCISLPHAVNVSTLESFASWLGFCFNSNEKSIFLEDSMNGSPGTGEIELVLNSTGSPCRIFLFESDNSAFQRQRYCMRRPFRPGLFRP